MYVTNLFILIQYNKIGNACKIGVVSFGVTVSFSGLFWRLVLALRLVLSFSLGVYF